MKKISSRMLILLWTFAFTAPTEKELLQSILEQLKLIRQELSMLRESLKGPTAGTEILSSLQEEIRSLRSEMELLKKQIERAPSQAQEPAPSPTVPPSPPSEVEVSIEGSLFLGSENAPVVVVEFTDYECPYCARHFRETLPRIRADYVETGKVKYILKDFPLSFHMQAKPAAIAARCAGAQEKYWEMHDRLFAQQRNLGTQLFQQLAQELGLNLQTFSQCLNSGTFDAQIDADIASARQIGVAGTPSFVIGKPTAAGTASGTLVRGAVPFERFQRIIESFLHPSTRGQTRTTPVQEQKPAPLPPEPQTPRAATVRASIDDDPILGNPDAPVTIIEFSDYQCPVCARFWREVLPRLKKEYLFPGKARLIYRDFPIAFHPNAQISAESAHCAGEQGKYWEMHDMIFQNQKDLSAENLKQFAQQMSLNPYLFNACLESGKYREEVLKDLEDAKKIGVRGTPSFVVGRTQKGKEVEGTLYTGLGSVDTFFARIDSILSEE